MIRDLLVLMSSKDVFISFSELYYLTKFKNDFKGLPSATDIRGKRHKGTIATYRFYDISNNTVYAFVRLFHMNSYYFWTNICLQEACLGKYTIYSVHMYTVPQ